ncbi:glutathione S-transferase family protein [Lacibacterium aquatile]|uniref:Glutathione S-transferase family protein n=1 Tax=Lacibacterium aquatile TaxID=1168082 RepID=A0ABW5DT72_9PROT
MRTFFHLWLSPVARKIRLILREKGLDFDPVIERVWERRPEFMALNPAAEVPVLIEADGRVLSDGTAIQEYLEEAYPDKPLIYGDVHQRAEIRRLVGWFDQKFNREVTANLVEEKVGKRLLGQGQPNSQAMKAGYANIHYHLDYIAYLMDRRRYLAGEEFSLADITAATHLSCLDYLGDVPWEGHEGARDWYARVKSRPSFRPLLADRVPGIAPVQHYDDLDF